MVHICFTFLITLCSTLLASPVPNQEIQNSSTYSDTQNLQSTNYPEQNANEIIEATTTHEEKDEDMETADMIIFRPLFVYRQKMAGMYRIQKANRRYYRPQYYYY